MLPIAALTAGLSYVQLNLNFLLILGYLALMYRLAFVWNSFSLSISSSSSNFFLVLAISNAFIWDEESGFVFSLVISADEARNLFFFYFLASYSGPMNFESFLLLSFPLTIWAVLSEWLKSIIF